MLITTQNLNMLENKLLSLPRIELSHNSYIGEPLFSINIPVALQGALSLGMQYKPFTHITLSPSLLCFWCENKLKVISTHKKCYFVDTDFKPFKISEDIDNMIMPYSNFVQADTTTDIASLFTKMFPGMLTTGLALADLLSHDFDIPRKLTMNIPVGTYPLGSIAQYKKLSVADILNDYYLSGILSNFSTINDTQIRIIQTILNKIDFNIFPMDSVFLQIEFHIDILLNQRRPHILLQIGDLFFMILEDNVYAISNTEINVLNSESFLNAYIAEKNLAKEKKKSFKMLKIASFLKQLPSLPEIGFNFDVYSYSSSAVTDNTNTTSIFG